MTREENIGYDLKHICRTSKQLSAQENLELVKRIQAGDNDAKKEFIYANGKLIETVIRKNFPKYIDSDDAFQQGILGLMTAAEKFDFTHETMVSTYAYLWIQQSIGRYILNNERDIRIPCKASETLRQIKNTVDEYKKEQHKEDVVTYVSNKLKLKYNRVKELIPYIENMTYLNSYVANGEGDGDTELIDFIESDEPSVEDTVLSEFDDTNKILHSNLNDVLTDKEKLVIEHRFGLNGNTAKTLEQIGEILGITREGVRLIQNKAIQKLKRKYGVKNTKITIENN